ncbi:transglycosylase family protein [Dermatobacter hominis]|uniref:transglycosylase family protein n=1 Tax=Dermatobacter hominis TaxID=2884263 RepID=UPI001D12A331|nr:transglycosylase family protein [Dermatobacter hominis]UDY34841.1 transglycosylase family protein [Dermatobacter hominis]
MTDADPTPRHARAAADEVPTSGARAARSRRAVAAVIGAMSVGALLVGGAVPAGSVPGADPVVEAQRAVAAATADRERAEVRLAEVSARRAQLERRTAQLAEDDTASTVQLADARRRVRELAVAAYIDGGRTQLLQASLDPEEAAVVAWRVGMVSGGASQVTDAVERFEVLQSANDPEQQAVAAELDQLRAEEAEARSDVVQTSALERDAGSALDAAVARRKQATAAARAASATAVAKTAPAARSKAPSSSSAAGLGVSVPGGGPTAEEAAFLAKVRQCESGGDYTAVSSTGRYRGAYQFSVETWRGVGGSGDPAAAPPAEQDARALALLRLQGKRAWPVCGRR